MAFLNQTNTVPHTVTNAELHNCPMFDLHSHLLTYLPLPSGYGILFRILKIYVQIN